jgi:hypothetical protein
MGVWLNWYSACPANERPLVQTPVPLRMGGREGGKEGRMERRKEGRKVNISKIIKNLTESLAGQNSKYTSHFQ